MARRTTSVANRRKYRVENVSQAKEISRTWLTSIDLDKAISFGLPEIDDRYHVWRVPLRKHRTKTTVGEVVIDSRTSLIDPQKTTKREVLESRLLGREKKIKREKNNDKPKLSTLRNTIGFGNSIDLLQEMPSESVDLIFTSPPYYNARPEYADYLTYEEYLLTLKKIIHQCHRVLNEGRFFAMNISPVLIRRSCRTESSKRIAVPFDIHQCFIEEQFEFIDDIIWLKPEGAGWATGRGRRFAADRNPLQYKAVPVTEYILVYRKKTDKLIDWHIRKHPKPENVRKSKISDAYEKTNVWKISPANSPKHPAIFPDELAEKVIQYYSFVEDVVLDPFAGIGTVGRVAGKLGRRFVLFEINKEYIDEICRSVPDWLGKGAADVVYVNCDQNEIINEFMF